MKPKVSSRKPRASFTLIELLVVVAIIAVLVAVLLPAVNLAREQGKLTRCGGGNIRQLGIGFLIYADENNGWFPMRYPSNCRTWLWLVNPPSTVTSVLMTDNITNASERFGKARLVPQECFYCPANQDYTVWRNWWGWWSPYSFEKVSYLNYYYLGHETWNTYFVNGGFTPRNINHPQLTEGVLFMDRMCSPGGTEPISLNHPVIGTGNILYGDGHVVRKSASSCVLKYQLSGNGYLW